MSKIARLFPAVVFLTLLQMFVQAQVPTTHVELCEQQIKRVNKQVSAKEKLRLYRKFFRKDTITHARQLERQIDSSRDAVHIFWKKVEHQSKLVSAIAGDLHPKEVSETILGYNEATSEDGEVSLKIEGYETSGLALIDDRMRQEISDDLGGNWIETSDLIQLSKDYMELLNNYESLKTVAKELVANPIKPHAGEFVSEGELVTFRKHTAGLDKLNVMIDDPKVQSEYFRDSTYMVEQARKKAEKLAIKYINENPEIMNEVRAKMNLLMKKYSVVPNSNDLSSAIKRTSLKGRTFRERLVVATNFQVISLDPVSIDFAPGVGYKFNKRFVAGVGGTYRQRFGTDSIPGLASRTWGYKVFASYDLVKRFFAYGEYGRNTPGAGYVEQSSDRIWREVLLMGAGRRFAVHRKVDMTLVVGYNFLHDRNDPIYPRPWVVRVGFQTSEVAMLKRKVYR